MICKHCGAAVGKGGSLELGLCSNCMFIYEEYRRLDYPTI